MKRRLQSLPASSQQSKRRADVAFQAPKGWLSAAHAAAYLDFPSVRAFYKWVTRYGVPSGHKGRNLIFKPADLDAAVGAGHRKSA